MTIFYSCNNSVKDQRSEQAIRDSIVKVLKDSIANAEAEKAKQDSIAEYERMHSKQAVEKDLKEFLSEYINTLNENIEPYLSTDFNNVIKKWNSSNNSDLGEWNLFGFYSSATVERYTILKIEDIKELTAKSVVDLLVECEGNYTREKSTINLVLENNKWVVDEIDKNKMDMKLIMKEHGL